jgi:hypothetical protein
MWQRISNLLDSQSKKFPFLFWFLIAVIFYFETFKIGFFQDSLNFLSTNLIPETRTASYWLDIFSKPNGWGFQYRPLGFFTYFYLAKSVLGTQVVLYRILSFCFMAAILRNLHLWARETFQSPLSYIPPFFLFFHYTQVFVLIDLSCMIKYQFVGWLFSLSMLSIWRAYKNQSSPSWALLTLTCWLSMLAHEGTITFSSVFLLSLMALGIRPRPQFFLCFVPAFAYAIARTFFWPSIASSFMAFQAQFIPLSELSLFAYLYPAINALPHSTAAFPLVFGIGLLSLSFILIIFDSTNRKIHLLLVATSLLLFLPFGGLKEQVYNSALKGPVWSVIPFSFHLAFGIQFLFKIMKDFKPLYRRLLFLGLAICALGMISNSRAIYRDEFEYFYKMSNRVGPNFIGQIESHLSLIFNEKKVAEDHLLILEPTTAPAPIWDKAFGPNYLKRNVLAPLLSYAFPHLSFFLPIGDCHDFSCGGVLVDRGYILFTSPANENVISAEDLYYRPHQIDLRDYEKLKPLNIAIDIQDWNFHQ